MPAEGKRPALVTRAAGGGYTLVEAAIVLTLLMVVLGSIALATQRGVGLFEQTTAGAELNARAGRAARRLAEELRSAGIATLFPDLSTPVGAPTVWTGALDYRPALDWQAGAVVWGSTERIALELAPGEADNGVDDDNDGLADERSLVWLEDPGGPLERRAVLANDVRELLEGEVANGADDNGNGLVDETGLSFDLVDGALTVRLTLEATGPGGRPITRTQETTVTLRN